MATSNQGIYIRPPFGGQRCDLDRSEVPWEAAAYLRNWVKREGKFSVRPGFTPVGTALPKVANGIVQYDHHSGSRYTVISTGTGWYVYDLALRDWVDITDPAKPLTNSTGHAVFRVFHKSAKAYVVGVGAYADVPKCWDGAAATKYANVGGTPPGAKCMAVCNNRMMLGNTYTTQANVHQIDVSAFNDFESGWGAVQTVNLSDTSGEIVALQELGSLATAVYKTDAIYMAKALAATEPFSFELSVPEIKGPASSRCVVSVPGVHIVMDASGGFYSFNGISPSMLPDALSSHVRQTADMGALGFAFGFYDAKYKEVWFIYRGKGSAYHNCGIIINMPDMTVWPLSFNGMYPTAGFGARLEESTHIGDLVHPISYYTDPIKEWAHFYNRIVTVDHTGRVVREGGYNDNGTAISAVVETRTMRPSTEIEGLSAGQGFTVQESEHHFERTGRHTKLETVPMQVEIGYAVGGADLSYTTPKSVDLLKTKRLVVGHRKTAEVFCLRLSTEAMAYVQWRGSTVSGVPRGPR